ncbi:DUF456 domain-containing protein [Deinococcus deserti]|uniref:DUF456 domain-containing protein n=1 Tax=Deinococcus deserti (strain DSM 17065 / CIP 109153 / LMG 22923 / VCD115) TaxID=546414 RepID=C1D1T6_DEIDV|nr:DUF456 family protein [Deinococcus deserti]ACO45810.1 conserved hypothetical protein; putative membrane protein [Deinococcus deserti VCD115]
MSMPFLIFLAAWIIGLIGTFVPVLPSTLVIFAGAAVAALLDGFQAGRDLPFLLVFLIIAVAAMLVDNLASAWGARRYGGSRQAAWGALIGGIAGIFLGPLGLIVGPLLGALLAELLVARRPMPEAVRSTWGTMVGLLTGLGAKFALHLLLGAYGLWHLWRYTGA